MSYNSGVRYKKEGPARDLSIGQYRAGLKKAGLRISDRIGNVERISDKSVKPKRVCALDGGWRRRDQLRFVLGEFAEIEIRESGLLP